MSIKQNSLLTKSLPPLHEIIRGTLLLRYMTCGNKNCKCHRGEKHGPYYYLTINYPKGKTKCIKIGDQDVSRVKKWLRNYKKIKNILEKILNLNFKLLKNKKRN